MSGIKRKLANQAATIALGQELALFSRKGLTICLYGDLGAGKTTLARALIQALVPALVSALANNAPIPEVPSPTFSLLQPYDELRIRVHHYDLYRVDQIDEIFELGLLDDLDDRLTIIEWPERLGDQLPAERIEIFFEFSGDGRSVNIAGVGGAEKIVARMKLVADFLRTGDWRHAERSFLQGDASSRRYERLVNPQSGTAILMDMPQTPDGSAIKDGKTYSQIAHIAEGIVPVAAINATLLELGFSSPLPLQQDMENSLMIIEDLGDKVFGALIADKQDISQPMQVATEVLVEMAHVDWPTTITVSSGAPAKPDKTHTVSSFGLSVFQAEAELLLDWFWPLHRQNKVARPTREAFLDLWAKVFPLVESDQPVWILRDFHSPNLIWMPERQDIKRVGLIDTQDCLSGHPAYDLVSMLQDARVDLPDGFEAKYFEYYCQLRRQRDRQFDSKAFTTAYAVFGAQRATKILGIFARLLMRDGKPGYLQHMSRVSAALEKNLKHPALADLADWYRINLPASDRHVKSEP